MNAPVVVTGMHRSGTTMLVRLLAGLGAHFGTHVDPNGEDYAVMRLDEWIMRRAGGAWDWPRPTLRFLAFPRFFDDTAAFLAQRAEEVKLGGTREGAWGFKDPRIVFTFPLWARVFPGARLLYIHRNGVDAAQSLLTRELARWPAGATGGESYLPIRPLVGRFRDALKSTESFEAYLFSTRCLTFEDAFALWEEYVAEGERMFAAYDGPKLALRYEEFIESPETTLAKAARFCGLTPDEDALRTATAGIDRTRAYAFLRDRELLHQYREVKGSACMKALGYGALDDASARR